MSRRFKTLTTASTLMIAGLLVAACNNGSETSGAESTSATDTGAQTEATVPAPAATPTEARLGKVDLNQPLRILGNEPSWSLDVTPSNLAFAPMDGAKHTANNPGAVVQGTTASWTAKTQAGTDMVATVTLKDCSDTMSDRIYPLSATVKIGDQNYTGCAASLKALEAAGESGRVE